MMLYSVSRYCPKLQIKETLRDEHLYFSVLFFLCSRICSILYHFQQLWHMTSYLSWQTPDRMEKEREELEYVERWSCALSTQFLFWAKDFPDYRTSVIMSHQERKGREISRCVTSLWLSCLHIHLWYVYSCWSGQRFNRVCLWVCLLFFFFYVLFWKAWVENRHDTGVIRESQLWETKLHGGWYANKDFTEHVSLYNQTFHSQQIFQHALDGHFDCRILFCSLQNLSSERCLNSEDISALILRSYVKPANQIAVVCLVCSTHPLLNVASPTLFKGCIALWFAKVLLAVA